MRLVVVLLLLFFVFTASVRLTNDVISYPKRHGMKSASVGNLCVFGPGSLNFTLGPDRIVNIYDFSTNTMQNITNARPRRYYTMTNTEKKIIIAGGYNFLSYENIMEIFDVNTRVWSTKNLTQTRTDLASASVGDYVLIGGGRSNTNQIFNLVEIFNFETGDTSNHFLSQPRYQLAATSVGNKVLFAGGYEFDGFDDTIPSNIVDIFTYTSGFTWSRASLSQNRSRLAATSSSGIAFFAGGRTFNYDLSDRVDLYHLQNGSWTTGALSEARYYPAASSYNDMVIFAGGQLADLDYSSAVDIYNVTSSTWSSIYSLTTPQGDPTIVSVGNLIYIASYQASERWTWEPSKRVTVMSSTSSSIATTNSQSGSSTPSSTDTFVGSTNSVSSQIGSSTSTTSTLQTRSSTSNQRQTQSNPDDKKDDTTIIVATVIPLSFIFIAIIIGVVIFVRRRRRQVRLPVSEREIELAPQTPSYKRMETFPSMQNIPFLVLGEEIGRGSGGSVYKAQWKELTVAVKRLNTENTGEEWKKTFMHECEIMEKMEPHPNLLKFYAVIEEPLSIVTEYCENGSLDHYLAREIPLEIEQMVTILQQIAKGMHRLAKQNIIHRDLAARNCLLKEDYTVVISDFGMSRVHKQDANYYAQTEMQQGWPIKWMAPETFLDFKFSQKSDVFSFGVVCVEVLSRQSPYPDYTVGRFGLEVLSKNLISTLPNYLPKNTPDFIVDLVKNCTAIEPADRPTFDAICDIFSSQ